MIDIDKAYKSFVTIKKEIEEYSEIILSEEDTKTKIINRILHEVLGYKLEEISNESHSGSGFIDYKISINNIPKLIIEAKNYGFDFNIDESYSGRSFKLNGPVFKNAIVKSGLEQTIYYAAMEGVELGCLTNGKTWIIFRATRLGDGKNVFEGKGFVFATLKSIELEFKLFYELLSRANVGKLKFRGIIQEAEGLLIRAKDSSKLLKDENNIKIITRSKISYDIDRVMNEFFSKLSGDSDPNLLVECFVETNESITADKQLLRISEDIISKIRTLESHDGEILKELIDRVKTTNRHEFVIIVGGKGAGKSTFIDRFFHYTLTESLKENCLLIRINVGAQKGDLSTIISWLDYTLLEECEKILFNGAPTYDEIVGIFFNEYKRRSEGTLKTLYESDKEKFKIDFGKHIESRRETRPDEYIKRLIGDITKSRKKVPCIVFDNTDHFGIDFQQKVFQYARSIYEHEVCLIIVPITDTTSWELSKQGAIQSFENETLFLPTPPPKKIIEKRIEYLEKILTVDENTKVNYFLKRGIKLEISGIEYFVKCLQNIFLKDPLIVKWVGNLANLDIRRCLDLTRDIIASPHISLDDLFKTFYAGHGEDLPIKSYKVKNAIIKKMYSSYPIGHHSFVQNLFYLDGNINTSPILSIRILQLLIDKAFQRNSRDNFLVINEVLDYFSNMGIERNITLNHLDFLLKKGLIFSYDPTILDIENVVKIEISESGREHYSWGYYDNDYLFNMAEVTPIVESTFYHFLEECYYNWDYRNEVILRFIEYIDWEDKQFCKIPDHSSYNSQGQISNRLKWRIESIKKYVK